MSRSAAPPTTLDLLKLPGPRGQALGVIVLGEDLQIPWGARRIRNLAKDVEVSQLFVASTKGGELSMRSFRPTGAEPDTAADLPGARLAVAALRQAKQWPLRGPLSVDISGTRVECGERDRRDPIRRLERRKIWSVATLDKELSQANVETRQRLAGCFSSGMGVIPFVGAGLSVPFGFPQWGELLTRLSSGRSRPTVERLGAAGQYEKAAETLYQKGRAADRLQAGIMSAFKRKIPAHAFKGTAVSLLPHLTFGPVVTTNFDQVLERVFTDAGRPFSQAPILGSDPDAFVPAIQRNERVLFKIHGDCENRRSLTLTLESYADGYGRNRGVRARESLRAMLQLLLANRPVLFLGCSLTRDRTLEVVREVHNRHAGIWHYAVVAAPYDVKAFDARRDELLGLGIQPLWFPSGEFECIRDRLRELLEDISVEAVFERATPPPPPSRVAGAVGAQARPPGTIEDAPAPPPPPGQEGLLDAVNAARARRVVFFLGAGAASGLLGKEFYAQLAKSEGIPPVGRATEDVAQHIIDLRKRSTLVAGIRKILADRVTQPSRTHRFLARLGTAPGRTVPPGIGGRLIILTTNQDQGLELAFEEQGFPYHLFVYQPHGEYEGLFLYRSLNGEVRVVRRPENIIELGDELPVIAKLNGGISFAHGVPDTFAATSRDFYVLAARIPEALPACLVTAIRERSLLFLAHGLEAPDVEQIIRYHHHHGDGPSWAVQWSTNPACPGPDIGEAAYWKQLGLELLWEDVDVFIRRLEYASGPAGRSLGPPPVPGGKS